VEGRSQGRERRLGEKGGVGGASGGREEVGRENEERKRERGEEEMGE
jgi:hypothetical protein